MNDSEPSTPPQDPVSRQRTTLRRISPKAKKEIHVVSIPHDDDMIAEEMAELFGEDEVTHKTRQYRA